MSNTPLKTCKISNGAVYVGERNVTENDVKKQHELLPAEAPALKAILFSERMYMTEGGRTSVGSYGKLEGSDVITIAGATQTAVYITQKKFIFFVNENMTRRDR